MVSKLAGICACLLLSSGLAARATEPPTARSPRRPSLNKRALLIGARGYQKTAPLRYPADDARAFSEFLQKQWQYPEPAIVLMTDEASDASLKPTLANIQEQLRRLADSVTKETELVVFFSGYGLRESREDWLMPVDGDPKDLPNTCISSDRMINDLLTKRPKRALLFLDADRNLQSERVAKAQPSQLAMRAARGTELGVLYSCDSGERSREVRPGEGQRGVFTHFLLQGLAGDRAAAEADGNITFDGLRRYVRGQVRRYVNSEYSDEQSPYGVATNVGMVLGKVPK